MRNRNMMYILHGLEKSSDLDSETPSDLESPDSGEDGDDEDDEEGRACGESVVEGGASAAEGEVSAGGGGVSFVGGGV